MTETAGDRFKADDLLVREIVARLVEGRPLDDLGLGEEDGRIDLRGFPASGGVTGGPTGIVVVHDAALDGLDLRGARLSSWRFHNVAVRDCRLDGADCRDWRLWTSTVERCSFADANLRGAAIGTWHDGHGNVWRSVDFRRADLREIVCRAAHFQDADFSNAQLNEVSFQQCTFIRCRFAGDLQKVTFDGRALRDRPSSATIEDVDFAAARFDRVEFLGFDLSGVVLPADPDLHVVRRFPCVVDRALAALDREKAESLAYRVLRADLESRRHLLRVGSHQNDANVINRRDYLLVAVDDLATLALDVFTQAEEECLQSGDSGDAASVV